MCESFYFFFNVRVFGIVRSSSIQSDSIQSLELLLILSGLNETFSNSRLCFCASTCYGFCVVFKHISTRFFLVFADSRGQVFSFPATRKQNIIKKPGSSSLFSGKVV